MFFVIYFFKFLGYELLREFITKIINRKVFWGKISTLSVPRLRDGTLRGFI